MKNSIKVAVTFISATAALAAAQAISASASCNLADEEFRPDLFGQDYNYTDNSATGGTVTQHTVLQQQNTSTNTESQYYGNQTHHNATVNNCGHYSGCGCNSGNDTYIYAENVTVNNYNYYSCETVSNNNDWGCEGNWGWSDEETWYEDTASTSTDNNCGNTGYYEETNSWEYNETWTESSSGYYDYSESIDYSTNCGTWTEEQTTVTTPQYETQYYANGAIGMSQLYSDKSGTASWYNITHAAELNNGFTVAPGQEFSLYQQMGACGYDQGYVDAGAYGDNGELIQAPGGGICFFSTGVYQVAMDAGCVAIERNNHCNSVGYATVGVNDAAVNFDTTVTYVDQYGTEYYGNMQDMRFLNTTGKTLRFFFTYDSSGAFNTCVFAEDCTDSGIM